MERGDHTTASGMAARNNVEFFASSWNRLDILAAIAVEPQTRADLKDLTDVSRVTLSRILADLEEGGWIARYNESYEATPRGRFVASEVTRLLDNLDAASKLGSSMEWLPLARFDFDLSRLRDATIITPTWDNFTAQSKRLIDLVYESAGIRGIATGLDHEFMRALWDASVNGDLELDLVLKQELFDPISEDSDLRRQFADMVATDSVDVYRYEGDDQLTMLGIHDGVASGDDVVMLCGQHENGAPPGTIETTDETVRSWAESFFDSVYTASRPLETTTFAQ